MSALETSKVDYPSELDNLGAYIDYCKQQISPKSNAYNSTKLLEIDVLNDKIDKNIFDREISDDFNHLLKIAHDKNVVLKGITKHLYTRLYAALRLIDKLYLEFESVQTEFKYSETQLKAHIEALKVENGRLVKQLNSLANKNESEFIALNNEKEAFMKDLEVLEKEKEALEKEKDALEKEKDEFIQNKADLEQKIDEWSQNCNVTDSYIDSLVKRIIIKEDSGDSPVANNDHELSNHEPNNHQEIMRSLSKKMQIIELLNNIKSPPARQQSSGPMIPQQVCYPWPVMTMPVCCCKKKENSGECCH